MNLVDKPLLHYRLEAPNVKNMLKSGLCCGIRGANPYF
jgi:hypothetical protein